MSRDDHFSASLEDFGNLLNTILSPSHAIKTPELLRGRERQLRDVREALSMRGRHVFIHGLRGVGKTSLAWSAASIIQSSDNSPIYVQCTPADTLLDLIQAVAKKALPTDPRKLKEVSEKTAGIAVLPKWLALSAGHKSTIESGDVPRPTSINDAVALFSFATSQHSERPVVIIDEFDHLPVSEHVYVDLFIKQIAEDDSINAKLILCGIGDSLEQLFSAHLSTYRYFHSLPLERLTLDASREIASKACSSLDVVMDDTTSWRIARVSDGFPHFVHLICEKTFWSMYNDADKSWISQGIVALDHYRSGTRAAVSAAMQELRDKYDLAVRKYKADGESILWAAADGHELIRKIGDMYDSYVRIIHGNKKLSQLTENQFNARVYTLAKASHCRILKSNKRGWYEFDQKMMRGYARLRAEAADIDLYPDHPLVPRQPLYR